MALAVAEDFVLSALASVGFALGGAVATEEPLSVSHGLLHSGGSERDGNPL